MNANRPNAIRLILPTLAYSALAIVTVAGAAQFVSEQQAQRDLAQEQIEQLQNAVTRLEANLAELDSKVDAKHHSKPRPARPGRPDPSLTYAVPVADSPALGRATAPITIVQFADYQCPFCKRAQGTLAQVRERYGSDVRIVFKHMPLAFHHEAKPAAIAAECAKEQGAFWPMSDALLDNNRALNRDTYLKLATELELDRTRFSACLENAQTASAIDRDIALAQRFGVRGTPAFFVNGRFVSGAQPFRKFSELIDSLLPQAERDAGFTKDDYYNAFVMRRGLNSVE